MPWHNPDLARLAGETFALAQTLGELQAAVTAINQRLLALDGILGPRAAPCSIEQQARIEALLQQVPMSSKDTILGLLRNLTAEAATRVEGGLRKKLAAKQPARKGAS